MGVNKNKTLIEVSKTVGKEPHHVWSLLLGETTKDWNIANLLETETGIPAKIFMFHESRNVRSNILTWFCEYMDTTKMTAWRYVHGYCSPRREMRDKIQKFSGMEPELWNPENYKENWMLSKQGKQNNKKRKKGKK